MTRVDQPLCDNCQNYDGGNCHIYQRTIDMHGQTPIIHCPEYRKQRETHKDTTGDAAGKGK